MNLEICLKITKNMPTSLLDQETMICMTQNDGGKEYILRRD